MITCDIGTKGRFGNQMFQYAALVGIAKKQNLEYAINCTLGDASTWDQFGVDDTFCKLVLNKAFDLSAKHCSESFPVIQESEQEFHFQERFFKSGDNVKFSGYFQTNKYFDHCKDFVRQEFTFKKEINDCVTKFLENKQNYETVSVHIRRGDYLKYPWHNVCDIQYFNNAMHFQFSDKPYNFIIITDDIGWAKNTIPTHQNVFISETRNQFVDMCIMTRCNHNIISNSSFSWWGSWLNQNENKKIVAPSVWFKDHLKGLNTKDLYQPNWIVI